MKKQLYVALCAVLGMMLGLFVHASIEIPVIWLLLADFDRWGLGLSWGQWETLHAVGGGALVFLGVFFGLRQGRRWWRAAYET